MMDVPAIEAEHAVIVRGILLRLLPPGARVWVYGSRARGARIRRGSDLDLAIDTGAPMTFGLMEDLQQAFAESDLPYKVDLLDLRAAQARFKALIEADMIAFPLSPAACV